MRRLFTPSRPPAFAELVILLAGLMSLMAFSIDSLLPAMPAFAAAFSPDAPSRAQLVVSAFIFGAGVGQLFIGPFSDSYGRRRALVLGVGFYALGALMAMMAFSLESLLAARFVQGLGAAAGRVVSQSVTRDLFSGRAQARVGSLIFTFFIVVPAIAPLIGQGVISVVGWRGLFGVYLGFGVVVLIWFLLRQPETLDPAYHRPFRLGKVMEAILEVVRSTVAMRYLVVMTLGFGQLMAYISSAQEIYVEALGVGARFPLYFALVALVAGTSGPINARLVMRLGMRPLASVAFGSQLIFATLVWALWAAGAFDGLSAEWHLWIFIAWSISLFFMNGLTFGNVTALAMEPLGHIAGTASAVIGAFSSILAVGIAAPVGLAYDGSPKPLMLGVAICSAVAFALVWTDRARDRTEDAT